MAKKAPKKKQTETPLDDQVIRGDNITIADVKDFIKQARKKRENWEFQASRSWAEIKKRNKKGGLYGGNDLDRLRRWTKFPLWWSTWQIRQPITFARLPIPVLKDTQGDDPYGRTACVIGERLTRGILKTFDAFPEFAASNDNFLVTNVGWGRGFYRCGTVEEIEKVRLQELQPPEPQQQDPNAPPQPPMPPMFITPDGQPVQQQEVLFDDLGPYIATGNYISVENEEVYFDAGGYCNLYLDPDAIKWADVTRLGFENQYSYRKFREKFGQEALDKLSRTDIEEHKDGKPIIVFEYHDKYLKEVYWCAENSDDFFQPSAMPKMEANVGELNEIKPDNKDKNAPSYDNSDLFGLDNFFPCTAPLMHNNSTDELWPTSEYFQVADILDDVHTIVGRIILLTRAIRIRFLFEASFPALNQTISELGEADGLAVPNLSQALMNNKGDLRTLVAYFPVEEMINGLKNMYEAFQQRLDMFYNITGVSDLIRGQTPQDGTQKTFGEKQLEGKFALNRIEPFQRKLQEWIKNNYNLLMEMGLKLFSDETLDEYITPQTLDEEDQGRYVAALELLKENRRRRFRVDFETDSTYAINEQWKKQQAIDLVNAATKAMESVANVAETQPELAGAELKLLKHLIGEMSPDGKLFIDDITKSIEEVIQRVSQPKPDDNSAAMKNQIDTDRLQFDREKFQVEETSKQNQAGRDDQFRQLELQAKQQLEFAKLQQNQQIEDIKTQLAQFKIQVDNQQYGAELQKEYEKLHADIALAQQDLQIKHDGLLVELRKVADAKEVASFDAMITDRTSKFEQALATYQTQLETYKVQLDEKEKYATEARLQSEHKLTQIETAMSMHHEKVGLALEHMKIQQANKELQAPNLAKAAIDSPIEGTKVTKVLRDASGNISALHHETIPPDEKVTS